MKIDNGLTTPAAPGTQTTLQDVGRDPWFLNALKPGSESAREKANAVGATSVNVVGVAAAPDVQAPSGQATTSRAKPGFVAPDHITPGGTSTNHATALHVATSTSRNAATLPAIQIYTPSLSRSPTGNTMHTAPTPRSVEPHGNADWSSEKITLQDSADGIDVIARNYFADENEKQRLVAHVLQTLQDAGHRPARIRLNGETAWTADAHTGTQKTNPTSGAVDHAR